MSQGACAWGARAATIAFALALSQAPVQAQRVPLRIQPRAGDTLHLRLDQTVEINRSRDGIVGPSVRVAPVSAALTVLTRAVIEATDDSGAMVLATTDSVAVSSNDPALERSAEMARRSAGRTVRLRIAGDGMASVVEGATHSEIASFFARMPATLPQEAVTVGATWTRAMEVPLAPGSRGVPTGTLAAKFRLDSLTRGGDLAWISIHGTLEHTRTLRADMGGAVMDLGGDMGGHLTLDRRRGWITDARIEFDVRSTLSPPAAESRGRVMRMWMKVSQWLRVVPH